MITRETLKQQCLQGIDNETFSTRYQVALKIRCGIYLNELGTFLFQAKLIKMQTPEAARFWAISHDLEISRGRRLVGENYSGEYEPVAYFPELEIQELEVV